MAKWIHNITGSARSYQGREILAGAFFSISSSLESEYNSDTSLIADLANTIVKMSSDGVTDYSNDGSSNVDFLKGLINTTVITSAPSFGAKTFLLGSTVKKLFARNTGKPFAVTTGSNELSYTATYPWAKITGVECIGAEIGDYADLRVYDNSSGTYSGVANALLNQFGYTIYLAKDYYRRDSKFDSDIYVGMVLKITYNSISNKNVYINYLMDEAKT